MRTGFSVYNKLTKLATSPKFPPKFAGRLWLCGGVNYENYMALVEAARKYGTYSARL